MYTVCPCRFWLEWIMYSWLRLSLIADVLSCTHYPVLHRRQGCMGSETHLKAFCL